MTNEQYDSILNKEFRLPVIGDVFTVEHKHCYTYTYELVGFDKLLISNKKIKQHNQK